MIIALIITIGLCIYFYSISRKTVKINQHNVRINQELEKDIELNRKQLQAVNNQIIEQKQVVDSLAETAKKMREGAIERAQEVYKEQTAQLQSQYLEDQKKIEAQKNAILKDIEREKKKLADLEAKQLAYIQAKQREEAISANMDYYRLALDQLDINDIELLRELQPRFVKKETIDKIIWDAYYKPAFDILSAHLFQNAGTKVCGIYKLTDQITGQSYVGQSVDARERFRTHIKTALTHGKASNKLYQAMQKDGLYNFTFEILEEVPRSDLNDREAYWIGFYKTKEFGLNGTKGNMT